jgi:hypothetical protein
MKEYHEIIWPEDDNPHEEAKVTQQILELFKSFFPVLESSDQWLYFLVPDPAAPVITQIDKWIKAWYQLKEDNYWRYKYYNWGNQGWALKTNDRQLFQFLLPRFFNARSDYLGLIIVSGDLSLFEESQFQIQFLETLMTRNTTMKLPTELMSIGLLFDWGQLIEIFNSLPNSA